MPSFVRGETEIHYESYGSGYPVLAFAPGGLRSAIALWERAPWHPVRELSSQFRVLVMDQRNAGSSRAPITATDGWHSYTRDQLALLDELGIERCHALGGCIGGAFALALAVAAPGRVTAAVIQQTIGYDGTNRGTFHELFDGWAAEMRTQRHELTTAELARVRANLFDREFVFSTTRIEVSQCETPLLVLRGNDVYHPAAISEEVARVAPHAELVEEWKTGEALPRAVERVRAFLTAHVPTDPRIPT